MTKRFGLVIAAAAFAGTMASTAGAMTVNFEDEVFVGDAKNVGTSFSNGGISFSSLDGSDLILVKTGDPVDAFVPNDTPKSGDLGRIFLTSDFKDNNMTSNVLMSFGSAVTSAMFDIVDIDGRYNNAEVFTFDFLLNGVSVFTKVVTSGDAGTGDAVVTTISYSGLFDAVEISNGTVGTSTRNIGWGLDNIMTTPVPLPAGVWLMGTALAGFGVASRRRRKAS